MVFNLENLINQKTKKGGDGIKIMNERHGEIISVLIRVLCVYPLEGEKYKYLMGWLNVLNK